MAWERCEDPHQLSLFYLLRLRQVNIKAMHPLCGYPGRLGVHTLHPENGILDPLRMACASMSNILPIVPNLNTIPATGPSIVVY